MTTEVKAKGEGEGLSWSLSAMTGNAPGEPLTTFLRTWKWGPGAFRPALQCELKL